MHYLYEQMLLQQKKEECPPAIHPELSSLIDYLNKWNYTTIYGPASNLIFLWNIISNQIPPHSSLWHPQSFTEWCNAQPGNALFGVLLALLGRLLDSGLAKKLAAKYKVNPSRWGYVKMTSILLFSLDSVNSNLCATWRSDTKFKIKKKKVKLQSKYKTVCWQKSRRRGSKTINQG